ncbi:hypothetical protein EDD11_002017 [Mortierella claussenii]|nr:hypothetical protein EDD11_002017 [Mortierella claussenii]
MKLEYRKSVKLYESFVHHIEHGDTEQANFVKQDFGHHFQALEAEMSRNQELQQNMVEMQQRMMELQHYSMERLARIQNRVQAILTQQFEVHEYPRPRLFIVLPKEVPSDRNGNGRQNGGEQSGRNGGQYRLHFLCECGEHTKSSHSQMHHHLHLAKHEGYDLERPHEFFRRYGQYVLKLLQMFKYGINIAGFSVPALGTIASATSGVASYKTHLYNNGHYNNLNGSSYSSHKNVYTNNNNYINDTSSLELGVNKAIEFLKDIVSQDPVASAKQDAHGDADGVTLLQAADLKRLGAFLKNTGRSRSSDNICGRVASQGDVLGNLYRVVTNEGLVRWVCSDHHQDNFHTMATAELEELTNLKGGVFDEHHGRVEISLSSPTLAAQFYKGMERARTLQELKIRLTWDISYQDAKALKEAIDRSNVSIIELICSASTSAGELLNRNKRAEPIWQIMSSPKVRSFNLEGYIGFFKRGAVDPRANQLRVLRIAEEVDWKKDSARVIDLLKLSPFLTKFNIGTSNVRETFEAIREAASLRCPLTKLTLEASKDERMVAKFDQPGQTLTSLDLVIPTFASYDRLLYSIDCLSTLHISQAKPNNFVDCGPIVDLIYRNRNLTELKIACYVSEFINIYEAIRGAVTASATGSRRAMSKLKKVCLYKGDNQLSTTDIRSPHLLVLELMHMKIHEDTLQQVLTTFGNKLTKLKIDSSKWKPMHSDMLLDVANKMVMQKKATTRLTHLYMACSDVDENILPDLAAVINRSSLLQEFQLVMDESFRTNPAVSMKWVEFIHSIGPRLTSLIIPCPDPEEWVVVLGDDSNIPALRKVSFTYPKISGQELDQPAALSKDLFEARLTEAYLDHVAMYVGSPDYHPSLLSARPSKGKAKSEDFSTGSYSALPGMPSGKTRRTSAPTTGGDTKIVGNATTLGGGILSTSPPVSSSSSSMSTFSSAAESRTLSSDRPVIPLQGTGFGAGLMRALSPTFSSSTNDRNKASIARNGTKPH